MIVEKLKVYGAAALAFLAAAAAAFGFYQKSQRDRDERRDIEAARDVERKAADAIVEGEKRINEATNAKIDTTRRDHFEQP